MVFPRESQDARKSPSWGEKGGTQRTLLLLLLLVALLAGYAYFFTGLIKPHDEAIKAPAVEAPVVKKPLPPRVDQQQGPNVQENRSTAARAVKGVPVGAAKAQTSPKSEKPISSVTEQGKQRSTTPAVPAPEKPETKTAKPEQKRSEGKGAAKPAKEGKQLAPEKKQVDRVSLVADIVLARDVKKVETQLKQAGGKDIAVTKTRKEEPMHRLHVAKYSTRQEAETDLKKLQKLTESAFVLPENGSYALYAGSFYTQRQAAKERGRLKSAGFSVALCDAKVAVPVSRITARGLTREAAERQVRSLKKAGVEARIVSSK